MTRSELYEALDYVNHSRKKRTQMAGLVIDHPRLVAPLMDIAFTLDDPVSSKACWVLEFTAREKLSYIFPHLDVFVEKVGQVQLQSSVRPMAKICELLMLCYCSKERQDCRKALQKTHLEAIATACFDWLIGDHKVAAKAYSMTSLYLLGTEFDWIHPELRLVLEQNYAGGSAAYKARARHILAQLENK